MRLSEDDTVPLAIGHTTTTMDEWMALGALFFCFALPFNRKLRICPIVLASECEMDEWMALGHGVDAVTGRPKLLEIFTPLPEMSPWRSVSLHAIVLVSWSNQAPDWLGYRQTDCGVVAASF